MKRFAASILFLVLLLPESAPAQSTTIQVGATTVTVSPLATNLSVPWELVWGPDNFIWMTERGGRISRVNPATGQVLPLLTVADVVENSESGLLGMVLHPDFATSPFVYIVYNYQDAGALKEKLVRYTYAPGSGTLTNPLILLGNIPATTTHSGSRLLILPDRTLLMTTGDAQLQPEAQNINSLNGKILRLNLDGTVPANNPVAGNPSYTLGHRNPQGLVRAPNGLLYSSEHGPNNDDEVNLIEPGRNYGWPNVEGLCNLPAEQTFCAANNVREPLSVWTPTLAVAGLTYYDHPAIPGWRNSLLMCTLKASKAVQLPLNATGTAITGQQDFLTGFGRLRAICVSPAGKVYIGTSNRDGRNVPGPTDDRLLVLENRSFVPTAAARPRAQGLSVWPNPARQSVTVKLPNNAQPAATAFVYDRLGQLVRTQPMTSAQTTLDLTGLAAGLYVVQVQNGAARYLQQLVVGQ
ncbi:PQQ-dependent sugar dehydrogenase [Hymenobacter sp. BT175]|uniref:PQQ-dependent sugar dehydrogenase n=1 Tax=Hymenobacter translucens TaxID=2886507 RepID=UPI001D0DF754|nr:PQQ-dependent sugar dehydrogenase [Hymenobacter translucens]MCC2548243.1 PQQ-dependent sugar dehydrogenase [Hymenobacter translucens]